MNLAFYGWGWRPYVSVGERRRKAAKAMDKRRNQGHAVSPVLIDGRAIAKTFWGKAWCENLERYSDYENRLPRGRTYVRNGSVVDLEIAPGSIHAFVSGSELYEVNLTVKALPKTRWKSICADCGGAIDSLVELLQGRFSKAVMERICRQKEGLFPSPSELALSCSCPDWASMCKHVAAVLYGIGARFDHQPELLFRLRGVDATELIAKAGTSVSVASGEAVGGKVLKGQDLGGMFGIDMAGSTRSLDMPAGEKRPRRQRVVAPTGKRAPAAKQKAAKKAASKRARKAGRS